MANILKKIGQFILDTLQAIVLAFSIFIIVYLFLFQPHQVKGNSMFPNYHSGEFILTNKLTYQMHPPQRGDVIVFKAPESEPCAEIECEYIKRIIAVPGDRIKVAQGKIFINGEPYDESGYLPKDYQTTSGSYLIEGIERVIPDNYFLPMGDNRLYSRDGREFGPVSKGSIIGKAWVRYWPLDRAGLVGKNIN